MEHLGERHHLPLLALKEIVELVLPILAAADPVETIKSFPVFGIGAQIASITVRLEPQVCFQARRNSRERGFDISLG
jgi:hypothetical protein